MATFVNEKDKNKLEEKRKKHLEQLCDATYYTFSSHRHHRDKELYCVASAAFHCSLHLGLAVTRRLFGALP